ncbi:MAG: radical SAM protein [Pseudomonadota bacterium]
MRVARVALIRLHGRLVGATGHPRNPRPPWTLAYLESLLLRDGRFGVRFHDQLTHPQCAARLGTWLGRWAPQVVVLQLTSLDLDALADTITLLDALPERPTVLAVGQALALGAAALPGVDLCLPGEAEERALSVITDLDQGRPLADLAAALTTEGPALVEQPSRLPPVAWDRARLAAYPMHYPLRMATPARWGHLLTGRGCKGGCLFCSPVTRESYGARLRLREPGEIMAEVRTLAALGVNVLSIDDDDFTADRNHVLAFCDGLARAAPGMRWICHARLDDLDAPLMARMAASGCLLLRFGVEAATPRILRILNKTTREDWEELALEVFGRARALGMATTALVLLGNPDETREEALRSVTLARALRPDMVQFHYFTPYPGSPAFARYRDRIPPEAVPGLYHYRAPPVNLSRMGDDELTEIYRSAYRRVLLRPGFLLAHLRTYAPFYLRNPGVLFDLLPHRSAP